MPTFRVFLGIAALFAAGYLLQLWHPLGQQAHYHQFVDTRAWLGIKNAADVLSNILIFFAGLIILNWVRERRGKGELLAPGLLVTGLGLVLTGFGSAYYHYAPSDATLIWDRLPLAVVFGGVLITLWSSATLARPNLMQTAMVVAASMGSVAYWVFLDSLWPYVLLQYGGLLTILYLTIRNRVLGVSVWWSVIHWYALAKAFEYFDKEVWVLTGQLVSGHTLKHFASAAAGVALVWLARNSRYIVSR